MPSLTGKHGLIVGVANKRSIAWGIAQAAAAEGARLALTYQNERLKENVDDLAASLENPLILPCDVAVDQQIADAVAAIDREFGGPNFLLHRAAFARAAAPTKPFLRTSTETIPAGPDVAASR